MQLSVTLRAVVCQILVPKEDETGRVAAREIMIVNNAISNLIRDGKTHQIYSAIETGRQSGMINMDSSLKYFVLPLFNSPCMCQIFFSFTW